MKVKLADSFVIKLKDQVEYIAKDKPKAARKFKTDILLFIKKLAITPLNYRRSIYFDDISIRDGVYKGYKIVFKIDFDEKAIIVFGLIKEEEKLR